MKLWIAFIAACLAVAPASAKGFIAIVTHDAAPLVQFYRDAFDTKLVRTVRPKDRDVIVSILDGPLATIEIVERADAKIIEGRANTRVGFAKAGFQVDRIEPWLARWRAMGARIIIEPFDDPAPPMRSVVLIDPDGNALHIMAPLAPGKD